jgi:hypothetical protein
VSKEEGKNGDERLERGQRRKRKREEEERKREGGALKRGKEEGNEGELVPVV